MLTKTKIEILKLEKEEDFPDNFTGIVEFPSGLKQWYKNGKLHREDSPAVEYSDGSKYWYKNGLLHREGGPAKDYSDGHKEWYKEGKQHREDGPAFENFNGYKSWWINGERHRLGGPAIEWPNGDKRWYLEDRSYLLINLGDYIVLDYYKGKFGLMWYKLLDEDKIIEYPDIPGLIGK